MAASSSLTATGWFSRYLRAPGGISLENASTHFTGKSMDIALSKEMLGRVFDGAGRPIDALGEIYPRSGATSTLRHQPVSRKYLEAASTPAYPPSTLRHPHPGAEACPSSPAPA